MPEASIQEHEETEKLDAVSESRIFNLNRMHLSSPVPPILISFAMIMFLVGLADAVMSYFTPVYLDSHLPNSLIMGLVLASSSVVGICCDLVFGEWFRGKKFSFFLVWTFVAALSFPLALKFLPPIIPFFIVAMGIWGVYYELIQFSNYHFIQAYTKQDQHAVSWGLMSAFKSLAYAIGPLLASSLIDRGDEVPFNGALVIYAIGALAMGIFLYTNKQKHSHTPAPETRPHSIVHEFKIWRTIYHKIWHLLLFVFTMGLVDATFWSVGTVLSEELKNGAEHGLLLVLYGLPSLFMGILAGKAARPFGKKRAAFICGAASGLLLTLAGIMEDQNLLLLLVFTSSMFLAISWPEVYAVFEDYVCRLGKTGNDFIGLQSSAGGLAYVVGPILAGAIAASIGNQATFSVMGVLLLIVSLIALVIVPRKIKMPQEELVELNQA